MLNNIEEKIKHSISFEKVGVVTGESGNKISVAGVDCNVGTDAISSNGNLMECVGFDKNESFFVNLKPGSHASPGEGVYIQGNDNSIAIPTDFLGRVLDSYGNDLRSKKISSTIKILKERPRINPLDRPPIKLPIDVGVSSINTFCSIGRGQRIGIMAGSGVGKSTLLGMITRFTNADSIVVSLVGERGREVQDFINQNLTAEARDKCVIVATPADSSSLEKIKGAELSCSIAEHLRDKGDNVLFLMDSITRYANSYRDILIDGGEMPISRGYPPSTFSKIYNLIERAGNSKSGSITGIYTILVDGDNLMDPIADHCRGILDGHIVLNRQLADGGIFPAIDISSSISRLMTEITLPDHQDMAIFLKSIYNTYHENKDLISMGYEIGSDVKIDLAIKHIDLINSLISQKHNQKSDLKHCLFRLREVFNLVNS